MEFLSKKMLPSKSYKLVTSDYCNGVSWKVAKSFPTPLVTLKAAPL